MPTGILARHVARRSAELERSRGRARQLPNGGAGPADWRGMRRGVPGVIQREGARCDDGRELATFLKRGGRHSCAAPRNPPSGGQPGAFTLPLWMLY